MITDFFVRPVYIYRSGSTTKNAYNDFEQDLGHPLLVAQVSGWLSPEAGQLETNDLSEQVQGSLVLFLPAGTNISYKDFVTLDGPLNSGTKYQVVGNPTVGWTPRGPHHIEARLTMVEG